MMLFDFFKKLFGFADESSRKRRAEDSTSLNEDFIQPKRRRGDVEMGHRLTSPNPEYSLDDDEEIKRSAEPVFQSTFLKKLPNGTKTDKSAAFCCAKSSKIANPLSKFSQRTKRGNSTMAENSNPNTSVASSFNDSKFSTLNKTHRLREKKQYSEMLQNFVPHRIQILNSKLMDSGRANQAPEVIDLEKNESRRSQVFNIRDRPPFCATNSAWFARNKIEDRIATEMKLFDDDQNRRRSVSHGKPKDQVAPSASSSSSVTSSNATRRSSVNESIVSNSLRDRLASKAVIKADFIPQVAKRYNARIEERNKEAEELKRMTALLAKQNRLARETALEEQLARSMRLCEAVIDDREEPEEAPLPVLTPVMLQEIRQALVPHPPNQVLAEGFGLQITRKDIHTLAGLNWLNDEVINFYMNLLIVRGTNGNFPKVHVMNTFFYPKLLSGGHSSLKRWTRKVDIFAKDLLVVPIHLGMHWCMSIVDFREKTIRYFDSMGGSNPKCLNALRQYLQDESMDKKKQPYDTSNWTLESVKDIPQQMNGSDCGVFSCMFAEYISANKRLTFTQKDMPYFRNKMVYEILKSKLL